MNSNIKRMYCIVLSRWNVQGSKLHLTFSNQAYGKLSIEEKYVVLLFKHFHIEKLNRMRFLNSLIMNKYLYFWALKNNTMYIKIIWNIYLSQSVLKKKYLSSSIRATYLRLISSKKYQTKHFFFKYNINLTFESIKIVSICFLRFIRFNEQKSIVRHN